MRMRIEVANMMGIENFDLELETGKVVEVIGPNSSGKSSLATCASALLAREGNPHGIPIKILSAAYYRHGAQDRAYAKLTSDEQTGELSWEPVKQSFESPGTGKLADPLCRPESVGLVDFCVSRGDAQKVALLQSVLLPDPSAIIEEVYETLIDLLEESDAQGIVNEIKKSGWKSAEEIYRQRAKLSKSNWSKITGRDYGVRVAADWIPEGWLSDYDTMTVIDAESEVVQAREVLTALHRVDAVSEAEMEKIEEAKTTIGTLESSIPQLEDAIDREKADQRAANANVQSLKDRRRKLESSMPELKESVPCPYCGEPILIVGRRLVKADGNTEEIVKERDRIKDEINQLDDRLSEAESAAKEVNETIYEYEVSLRKDKNSLSEMKRLVAGEYELQTDERKRALAEAEMNVETARNVVKLVEAREQAAALHKSIAEYTEIYKILGPSGIRATLLDKGLKKLNAGLDVISNETGWHKVEVDAKGNILVDEDNPRPVFLCSESERWRVQAAMQLTIAAMEGDPAVVLDRADLLDDANRAALITAINRVIAKRPMAIMVCSTGTPDPGAEWEQVEIEAGNMA